MLGKSHEYFISNPLEADYEEHKEEIEDPAEEPKVDKSKSKIIRVIRHDLDYFEK